MLLELLWLSLVPLVRWLSLLPPVLCVPCERLDLADLRVSLLPPDPPEPPLPWDWCVLPDLPERWVLFSPAESELPYPSPSPRSRLERLCCSEERWDLSE